MTNLTKSVKQKKIYSSLFFSFSFSLLIIFSILHQHVNVERFVTLSPSPFIIILNFFFFGLEEFYFYLVFFF